VWQNELVADLPDLAVRQRPFESVANLDEHLAVLYRHEKDHAVVLFPISRLPRLRHAHRIVEGALGLGRAHGEYRDLRSRFALEVAQKKLETPFGGSIDNAGVVGNEAAWRRDLTRCRPEQEKEATQ